jgi:SAM-dependent methyltransferase
MARDAAAFEKNRDAWEDLAALDPYWATITADDHKFGQGSRESYFRTGVEEIGLLMAAAARLGRPAGREAALDFGCGLGRLTRARAAEFRECCGVDISRRMIEQARELNRDVPGCLFLTNEDDSLAMFPDGRFDLAYTNVVLEHVPRRETIRAYVGELLRTLKPGGLLVFQLPSGMPLRKRLQPRRRLYALLRGLGASPGFLYRKLGLHPILMNHIGEAEMRAFLAARGAAVLDVKPNFSAGDLPSRMYYVTR